MQYFRPEGDDLNVGDCLPFFHDGTFHFFYLLDRGHHKSRGGLGEHQWAHASSADLVHWTHHPLAIPITEEWEGSICTGSAFWHDGTWYGFYATRMPDRTQHLSVATSTDGIHFAKRQPNPFFSPPEGYDPSHFRDPTVFRDERTGLFHMLVTAMLTGHPVPDRGGCLAHLVSRDLLEWRVQEPFLVPGYAGAPECPDAFAWNGWHYLVFSNGGVTRYRVSREPLGPWLRPKVDTFDGPMARVLKTAAFTGNRRLGAAFLPMLDGNRDDGGLLYGGHAVFREIVQHADGSLGTRFPAEMVPRGGDAVALSFRPLTDGVSGHGHTARVSAPEGLGMAILDGVPENARVTLRVLPAPGAACFGLGLRASDAAQRGCELRFEPHRQRAGFADERRAIHEVAGLDEPFGLDIILKDGIIDVCIGECRTLVTRYPEARGDALVLFAHNAEVTFDSVEARPLL